MSDKNKVFLALAFAIFVQIRHTNKLKHQQKKFARRLKLAQVEVLILQRLVDDIIYNRKDAIDRYNRDIRFLEIVEKNNIK